MRRNGCRTEVNRQPVNPAFVQSGPYVNNAGMGVVVPLVNGDRNLPIALAKYGLQFAQYSGVRPNTVNFPLRFQRPFQPLQIAGRRMHVRFFHMHKVKMRCGIHDDRARCGGFANHLFVHLTFRWHVDDNVALNRGLTA